MRLSALSPRHECRGTSRFPVVQAKPESTDFAKLVTWVSRGAVQPGVDDFAMLRLLFRTFLPQVGGLVLMLAQRNS
jgi:hypothetical protein